jgi:hypothetical protein
MSGHHLTFHYQYNNGWATNSRKNVLFGEVQQKGQQEALTNRRVVSSCGVEEMRVYEIIPQQEALTYCHVVPSCGIEKMRVYERIPKALEELEQRNSFF